MTYEVFLLKGQPIEHSIRHEKVDTYVGTLRFGELAKRYQIPRRVHLRDQGYQRNPSPSRVNRLTRDLRRGHVDLPTAILLSVRDKSIKPRLDSSGRYIMTLPGNGARPFYVVDGQHRIEALKKVMNEDPDGNWQEFKIAAVIMFGADRDVEMDQFHTVNSNAKSIPTDLALDLLKTRAEKDGSFRKYVEEKGETWKVVAQDLTERVSKHDSWRGKIRFPNEAKGRSLIKSNSFATSLRYALDQVNFSKYSPEQRAEIIDAYWLGIRRALPKCFEEPAEYNIEKTVGVAVLNYVLPRVLAYAQDWGSPVFEPDTFANILGDALRQLSGDNRVGEEAVGENFWKVGPTGASGVYSSHPGRRVLRAKIISELEESI